MLRELGKAWHLLLSLPKTLAFNLRYFPLARALRLPVLISHRVRLARLGGAVELQAARFGCVRIGFPSNDAFSAAGTGGVWSVTGRVSFGGALTMGPGARILCAGDLALGDAIDINANCLLACARRISVGAHGLWAWNVTVMDHDFHPLYDAGGSVVNEPAPVEIGAEGWLGAGVTVLKGARLARGTVAGAGAVVSGGCDEAGCVIAGNPARIVRRGVTWRRRP